MLIFSVPPAVLPLSFGKNIMNEGSFAQLSCIVPEGDEPIDISWSLYGIDISSSIGITTTKIGTRGNVLMIPSVCHVHSGMYECKADNAAGSASQSVNLQVNGKGFTPKVTTIY